MMAKGDRKNKNKRKTLKVTFGNMLYRGSIIMRLFKEFSGFKTLDKYHRESFQKDNDITKIHLDIYNVLSSYDVDMQLFSYKLYHVTLILDCNQSVTPYGYNTPSMHVERSHSGTCHRLFLNFDM